MFGKISKVLKGKFGGSDLGILKWVYLLRNEGVSWYIQAICWQSLLGCKVEYCTTQIMIVQH